MKLINRKNITKKINLFLITVVIISPSAYSEVTLDGSMGSAGTLSGPDYQITQDLGKLESGNLFHSFGQFNINNTESATFSGSAGIKNVISRVTGGQASTIDGVFRSTIPGANVYFLNPSGVIFGENSSLDVQGSFHASTADYLKFKDGVKFETGIATANPILTTATPEAFGFLDDTPAPISVSGGNNKVLEVPEDATFSLIGGDISIDNRSLYAPSGQVILASAGSAGELIFNNSGIDTSSFTKGGDIHLSRAANNPIPIINETMQIADIDVSADAAGKVVIRGGQMVMDNAYIWADTTNGNGGDIAIDLKGDLTIKGVPESPEVEKTPSSGITADSQGNGNAGNIQLNVADLKLTHGTRISSTARSSGSGGDLLINANSILLEGNNSKSTPKITTNTTETGSGGNLMINATNSIKLSDGAKINNTSQGAGNAGDFELQANNLLEISRGASIDTSSYGKGNGGKVSIKANTISIAGEGAEGFTGIKNSVFNAGDTADLTIRTHKFELLSGANIWVSNFGSGNNGDLILNAENGTVLLSGKGIPQSHTYIAASSLAGSTGKPGNIIINSDTLQILDGAQIFAPTSSNTHHDRVVKINSHSVVLSGENSGISTGSLYDGKANYSANAASIDITVQGKLELSDGAVIESITSTNGHAGSIDIYAGSIELSNAIIFSQASPYNGKDLPLDTDRMGNAGNISIKSQSLNLENGTLISSNTDTKGRAGDITLRVININLTDASRISSATGGAGNAGNISIEETESLTLKNGASISSSAFNNGLGGNITVDAKNVFLSGSIPFMDKGDERIFFSSISASTYSKEDNAGNAGKVTLNNVDHLEIRNGAEIKSNTKGAGSGGELDINAKSIFISNDNAEGWSGLSAETSSHQENAGKAGNITVDSENIVIRKGGGISVSTEGHGNGGKLKVTTGKIELSGEDSPKITGIFSHTFSKEGNAGKGGEATINVGHLNIQDKAEVSAGTFGHGDAGNLTVDAESIFIKGDPDYFTGIASQANTNKDPTIRYKGNAGNVVINATGTIELYDNARISSGTFGIGKAGDVIVNANDILLNNNAQIQSFSEFDPKDIKITENSEIAKSGKVTINAKDTLTLKNNSAISVQSDKAHAGEINITSGNGLNVADSFITTSVADGAGNGGNIKINSPFVSLDKGKITAKAKKGFGGNIFVSGFLFKSPSSIVDASSETNTNGKLKLKPDTNISGNLAVLPESLLNVSDHLSDRCTNRSEKNKNRFVIKSRGGVPLSPGKLMPSMLINDPHFSSTNSGKNQSIKKKADSFILTNPNKFLAFNQQIDCHL